MRVYLGKLGEIRRKDERDHDNNPNSSEEEQDIGVHDDELDQAVEPPHREPSPAWTSPMPPSNPSKLGASTRTRARDADTVWAAVSLVSEQAARPTACGLCTLHSVVSVGVCPVVCREYTACCCARI